VPVAKHTITQVDERFSRGSAGRVTAERSGMPRRLGSVVCIWVRHLLQCIQALVRPASWRRNGD
jgi:hypothetical protein